MAAIKKVKGKGKSPDEILEGFQALRGEQRHLATKISEMELELHEHKIVIETLKDLDGERKCFRMIGGVLCERQVKDVLPILRKNKDQLELLIETLTEQLTKKGKEVNEYKEKFNIRVRGQDDPPATKEQVTATEGEQKPRAANVLVTN